MDRPPPTKMESRDSRLCVRLTATERESWDAAARASGEETSRFFRKCAAIGKRLRDAQIFGEATGA
jgi:uncharacterized protein (DUF1778 family)